jgi:dolichyl-phosphate beta-glucosyltransferase
MSERDRSESDGWLDRPSHDPRLSVVLPCYKAARLARRTVAELADFLESYKRSWEIVVVDDGGGDFGPERLSPDPRIRLLKLPVNIGKGGAVAAGMLEATGCARVFTDIDLPYGAAAVAVASEYILERQFHVVIGDRTMRASRYSDTTASRQLASNFFSRFVGILVTGGFFDTQCGLKGFRGDVADAVFSLARLKGFTFDVEVVYLALRYHADIKRIPVQLLANEQSSVRISHDSLRMLADVLRIKYYQLRGCYDDDRLARIVSEDFQRATESALSSSGTSDRSR